MSDNDRKRIAAECFRKGTEAMNKENWDYAIDMFSKSMLMEADNLSSVRLDTAAFARSTKTTAPARRWPA